jgi:hypothetical protein
MRSAQAVRVYVTWKEFEKVITYSSRCNLLRLWERVFSGELLARIRQAESSKQTIELIPTVQLPPFRVEE